ncbi:MAG: YraN family protein [Eubacteriales bacterium]|jgi:putative endonuclease|nr:YraN family protein [Eubacteriales bacterium]
MSTTAVGRGGEARAEAYLAERGYKLLRRNYRSGPREIDLIMQDGDVLVFVEVKARSKTRYGTPGEFVTPAKRRLLTRAAEAYLMEEGLLDVPARFDVVEIYLGTDKIRHIENAFDAT